MQDVEICAGTLPAPSAARSGPSYRRIPLLRVWQRLQERGPDRHYPSRELPRGIPGVVACHGFIDIEMTQPAQVKVFVLDLVDLETGAPLAGVAQETAQASLLTWVSDQISGFAPLPSGRVIGPEELPEPEHPHEHWITRVAKHLAEESHHAVDDLRSVRYDVEDNLSASLRHKRSTDTTALISRLLAQQVLISRTAETAAQAVSGGMYLWKRQREAYHYFRSVRHPELVSEHRGHEAQEWPWLSVHDNGVRHCERLRNGLKEEVEALSRLVAMLTSLSASVEAEHQQRLGTVLSVGGLVIGVPALILALYSVDWLPLAGSNSHWPSLLPIFIPLIAALFVVLASLARKNSSKRFGLLVGLLIVALMGLLAFALASSPVT